MILSLLSKEWRELRWKLLGVCAIVAASVLFGAWRTSDTTNAEIAVVGTVIALAAVVWPIFVSMGLVAPERASGRLSYLIALPIRPWVVLAVKTLAGTVVCVPPILVAGGIGYLIGAGEDRPPQLSLHMTMVLGVVASIMLLVWSLAFGVREQSELRAGLIGICVFVGWSAIAWLWDAVGVHEDSAIWLLHPLALLAVVSEIGGFWPWALAAPCQVLIVAGLWLWAASRFTATGTRRKPVPVPARVREALTPRVRMLVWKEWHELRGVFLFALVVFAGLPLAYDTVVSIGAGRMMFQTGIGLVVALGGLLAIIVGVSAVCRDVEPGIQTFWRSRPIPPASW